LLKWPSRWDQVFEILDNEFGEKYSENFRVKKPLKIWILYESDSMDMKIKIKMQRITQDFTFSGKLPKFK
jgi:hypothetical protein